MKRVQCSNINQSTVLSNFLFNRSAGIQRMMAQQYSEKNQVLDTTQDDKEVCETTYFFIHSISTQYVNMDDKQGKRQSTKTNDVSLALKNMEILESLDNKQRDEENQEKSYSAITKQIDIKQQKILPKYSRWRKTFNITQEVLKPERTDQPIHTNIAIQFPELYTNETYIELLCKIAESNIDLLLKEIDNDIHVNTRNQKLLVPYDHFHSYLCQGNDIYCIVCHISFPEEEEDIHKYEIGHMNHVVKIIDHRGFRKVDYSYNHCVICNLRVNKKKQVKAHLKTSRHIETRKLLAKTRKIK